MSEQAAPVGRLGWIQDGVERPEWWFVHAGGQIGPNGVAQAVSPGGMLAGYQLPEPPSGEELRTAVRKSLRFLDVADHAQSWPLLAAMYTAPLATFLPTDFVLWIVGVAASGKSTAADLALGHFGVSPGRERADFHDTWLYVERLLARAGDVPVVVDGYHPAPDRRTQERMKSIAHRLLRTVGDLRASGRAVAEPTGPGNPRCLTLVTAELPPPDGESCAARALLVEWRESGVRRERLFDALADAPAYAQAMAGYLQHLANVPGEAAGDSPFVERCLLENLRPLLPALVQCEVDGLPAGLPRQREAVAKLLVGTKNFLAFAVHVGAITAERRDELVVELRGVLIQAGQTLAG